MVAQVADPQPSAPQQMGLRQSGPDSEPDMALGGAKTLICALNFLSRNLPLPKHVYDAVSSIWLNSEPEDGCESADEVDRDVDGDVSDVPASPLRKDKFGVPTYNDLMLDFEDAVSKQRSGCLPSSKLSDLKETRFQSQIKHRLTELEELPTSRGEELQSRCLIELYGIKLAELQSKVRSEVSSEYWLCLHCANPDKQLFDWGMMRLRRPLFGIGDAFAMETDDPLKKKREAERFSRFEEEEKNQIETRKRKFFADLLNAARELQLQVQAVQKRRKQRNDGVQGNCNAS